MCWMCVCVGGCLRRCLVIVWFEMIIEIRWTIGIRFNLTSKNKTKKMREIMFWLAQWFSNCCNEIDRTALVCIPATRSWMNWQKCIYKINYEKQELIEIRINRMYVCRNVARKESGKSWSFFCVSLDSTECKINECLIKIKN